MIKQEILNCINELDGKKITGANIKLISLSENLYHKLRSTDKEAKNFNKLFDIEIKRNFRLKENEFEICSLNLPSKKYNIKDLKEVREV